jgi:hypothetical protein
MAKKIKSPVHISKMTGKLDGFLSISTNTLTNAFCQTRATNPSSVCGQCYSMSMLSTYRKSVSIALQRNTELLSSRPLSADELPIINAAMFRFNSHGELINTMHLQNLVAIVRHNSATTFTLWSKRIGLVRDYFARNPIPANMLLIYSNPFLDRIMDFPPVPFHKTFNVVNAGHEVARQNCTGQKCIDCRRCYTIGDPTTTIVEQLK